MQVHRLLVHPDEKLTQDTLDQLGVELACL